MTDEMRERLARLDPMRSGVPTEPTTTKSSRELLEQIMSTPVEEQTEHRAGARRTWVVAVAAVIVLVLAVAGGLALNGGEDTPPLAGSPALELNAGGDDPMAMCIAFSVEELERVADIAFEGTVTSVDGETVTLEVDSWYRGDEASQAILHAPAGMEALIGGIPFEENGQYLITAQEGNVNYCGFSGPSTDELRAAFVQAFAQD